MVIVEVEAQLLCGRGDHGLGRQPLLQRGQVREDALEMAGRPQEVVRVAQVERPAEGVGQRQAVVVEDADGRKHGEEARKQHDGHGKRRPQRRLVRHVDSVHDALQQRHLRPVMAALGL
jgi:hypothetical protein